MKFIDIVFEDKNKGIHGTLPMPPALEFIEVENGEGASVGVGRWIEREDGFTVLRLFEDVVKSMCEPLYNVPFLCGDGSGDIMLKVKYIAGSFPRDTRGHCAFCHGDPCNEGEQSTETREFETRPGKPPITHIAAYFMRNLTAETCPCCKGAPS